MSRKRGLVIVLIIVPVALLFIIYSFSAEKASSESKPRNKRVEIQTVIPPEIPSTLTFAGEEVPLKNFDIKESLDKEIMVNTFYHSQTLRYLKLSPRYFNIIEPILKKNKIPDDFKYLALAESGLNPKIVSPAGAVGIWQFMKGTARENGLEVTGEIDERYHIEKATEAACKYLHQSFEKYGNWTTVAASYNVGRRGIDKQIERQNETHYYNLLLNEETARYVFRILAFKLVLESPEKYGFHISKKDIYPDIPVKLVTIKGKVDDFAVFAEEHGTNYKLLKYFNPWLRDNFLTNEGGKNYTVKIPTGKYRSY